MQQASPVVESTSKGVCSLSDSPFVFGSSWRFTPSADQKHHKKAGIKNPSTPKDTTDPPVAQSQYHVAGYARPDPGSKVSAMTRPLPHRAEAGGEAGRSRQGAEPLGGVAGETTRSRTLLLRIALQTSPLAITSVPPMYGSRTCCILRSWLPTTFGLG